ncbi:9142_t:CDS:2 [Gigaspora margarita]|uniref:9142_t:CDS:1 n=1 Tax=Gigaspora margarita TaxID=4874 RepID=A0ABM8VYZ8_GIGMA|nr:9142_t:CDS:2 [Gigaspora margarita]
MKKNKDDFDERMIPKIRLRILSYGVEIINPLTIVTLLDKYKRVVESSVEEIKKIESIIISNLDKYYTPNLLTYYTEVERIREIIKRKNKEIEEKNTEIYYLKKPCDDSRQFSKGGSVNTYSISGQFSSENNESDVESYILQRHLLSKIKNFENEKEILFGQIDALKDQLKIFYDENRNLKKKCKEKIIKRVIITSISYFLELLVLFY